MSEDNRGSYERKQLGSSSWVVSFSHRSRFELARRLVAVRSGQRLLDYGCGDATFLRSVTDLFPGATGTDVDAGQLKDCGRRLEGSGIRFVHVDDLRASSGAFDVVVCMETLEHCVPESVERVLSDITRLVAPGGMVVISVPIEIGPSLLGKQVVRRVLGWRKVGDYQYTESYTLRELVSMVLADADTSIARPAYPSPLVEAGAYHLHKGFNWKALRELLKSKLVVEEVRFSPLGWSVGLLSSQAWFICQPRS